MQYTNNNIESVGRDGIVKSSTNKVIDAFIVILVAMAALICLIPMLNVAATSLSSEISIINRQVFIWPVDLDLEPYKGVFSDKSMLRSLGLTALLTVVSTTFSMLMTIFCAYPLSQKKFVGRSVFNTVVILTMYFNAGIIPDYLNIKRLGLLDNFWAMVLPLGISVFNMIIIKSFFQGLPDSLQESAEMDGASHWTILFNIYIPLSLPALATIALFYAVGRWNGFQDARFYISSQNLYPIQFKLYQIISNLSSVESSMEGVAGPKIAKESMKAASIMFATIPILVIYPWLQRYFVTGVTLGAIKG
jgi:putative aldouronate transport system permease protein